jgi:surface antigen
MNKLKLATFIVLVTHLAGCSIFHSANSSSSTTPPATEMTNASVSEPITTTNTTPPPPTAENAGEKVLKPIDVSNVNTNEPLIGGSTERSMDANDKLKMSKALDKAPGKSTEWTNDRTGITYNVTPVKKIVINNNPFCREYETVITRRSNSNTLTGTACIGDDGNWHSL